MHFLAIVVERYLDLPEKTALLILSHRSFQLWLADPLTGIDFDSQIAGVYVEPVRFIHAYRWAHKPGAGVSNCNFGSGGVDHCGV